MPDERYYNDNVIPWSQSEYQPVHLETDRLFIDSIEEDDIPTLFQIILSDPDVMLYIGSDLESDPELGRQRYNAIMNIERRTGFGLYTIRWRETGDLIGTCGIFPVEQKGPEIELAYHIAKKWWRMGIASEAAARMLRFGFEEKMLDRIIAICDVDNTGSWKVMEKIGMSRIGYVDKYYGTTTLVYEIYPAVQQ